jgi:hypothetical protein
MSLISGISKYMRLASEMRVYLHNPISLEQSYQRISERLHNRENNFLSLINKGIYQNPRSPFLPLLKYAGCEFGEIESSVNRKGIEKTLEDLLAAGVYLSWEEFKGKQDVIRGGKHFQFKERDFDNPFLSNYYKVRSSGTRSAGTRTTFDLDFTLEKSYYRHIIAEAYNLQDTPMAFWMPILPSAAGLSGALQTIKTGRSILKWWTPVSERQVKASFRDKIALRYVVFGSRLWGVKIPWPRYVGMDNALIVAHWMADNKKRFGNCTLRTGTSLAVMVCKAAMENDLDINGNSFQVGGEPLTEAKLKHIQKAGARIITTYHISEIGFIGCGCPASATTDDTHFFHDSTALILRRRKIPYTDMEIQAFVYSSLLPSSPKILLNVENDDYGELGIKQCGCIFEKLGLTQHMSQIRSFSKFTGRGMTIAGTEMLNILEKILPERFGGSPSDYQLQEVEDRQSQTRLILVISPQVGDVNESEIIKTVLAEMQKGVHGGKLASGIWAQAQAIQIKRSNPIATIGKILPLYLIKK